MSKKKEYFTIKAVHRSNLTKIGFDAAAVDDSTMQELASILEEVYCELRFWSDLKAIAEDLGIPIKRSLEEQKS